MGIKHLDVTTLENKTFDHIDGFLNLSLWAYLNVINARKEPFLIRNAAKKLNVADVFIDRGIQDLHQMGVIKVCENTDKITLL